MFENIIVTFVHTIFLSVLLLIAFSLAFYMAFFSPGLDFTPFSNPGLSLFTVLTYVTAETDFSGLFSLSFDGNDNTRRGDLPFLPISVVLWTTFIIIMIILLINMLVSQRWWCVAYRSTTYLN